MPSIPDQIAPVDGMPNFRDLGGYPVGNGLQTRRRQIFRCAHFANTSASGWQTLASLNIKWVIDLREEAERNAAPTLWQNIPAPTFIRAPRSSGQYNNREMLVFETGSSIEAARQKRINAYCDKVLGFQHAVKALFDSLIKQDGAVAFHCMAGKDRTGFLAAVLLAWLGVSREDIIDDYLLTGDSAKLNVALDRNSPLFQFYGLEDASDEALQAMTEVFPECIVACLDTIEREHGGIIKYVETATTLTPYELETLKPKLLEPIRM